MAQFINACFVAIAAWALTAASVVPAKTTPAPDKAALEAEYVRGSNDGVAFAEEMHKFTVEAPARVETPAASPVAAPPSSAPAASAVESIQVAAVALPKPVAVVQKAVTVTKTVAVKASAPARRAAVKVRQRERKGLFGIVCSGGMCRRRGL